MPRLLWTSIADDYSSGPSEEPCSFASTSSNAAPSRTPSVTVDLLESKASPYLYPRPIVRVGLCEVKVSLKRVSMG